MKTANWITIAGVLLCINAACLGCLRIEHTIVLNSDGSGKLIEKIWVADWVIQAAKGNPNLSPISDLLQEKNVRDRIAIYGAVTFVSHEVTDRGSHGIESSTVMSFTNINGLILPVMLSESEKPGTITFNLGEKQKRNETTFGGWNYGVSQNLKISQNAKSAPTRAAMSPAEKQRWANLLPVLRTMCDGFKISAKIQAFGPINGKPDHMLYEMSDKDLAGEAMIDLLVNGQLPGGAELLKNNYTIEIAEPVKSNDDATGT